jgi:hypothetical protein
MLPIEQLAAAYGDAAVQTDRLGLEPAEVWASMEPAVQASGLEGGAADPGFLPMDLGF